MVPSVMEASGSLGEVWRKSPFTMESKMIAERKSLKRLFDIKEAATYLGRSSWAVRRLIWSGALPEVRTGKRVHLDIQDMDSFIERNKSKEDG